MQLVVRTLMWVFERVLSKFWVLHSNSIVEKLKNCTFSFSRALNTGLFKQIYWEVFYKDRCFWYMLRISGENARYGASLYAGVFECSYSSIKRRNSKDGGMYQQLERRLGKYPHLNYHPKKRSFDSQICNEHVCHFVTISNPQGW